MNVGKAALELNKARMEQGITFQEIADAVGVSKVQIHRVLTGARTLSAELMEKIAAMLGVDVIEDIVEPDPEITVRMPQRFVEWLTGRAADKGVDVETLVVDAVALWMKQDIGCVKNQSHENARALSKAGKRGRSVRK